MPGRSYTPEQRRAAVELGLSEALMASSRKFDIPKTTLCTWLKKERKRQAEAPAPASAEPRTVEYTGQTDSSRSPKTAKPKRGIARRYTPSERARAIEYAEKHGPAKASRHFGISRFSIYEWRRKARLAAEGKCESSPVSGSDEDPALERDRQILETWKANPGLGPSQIRNQLRRSGLKVSVHTARRVMEEHGYTPPKVKRSTVHDGRYEAVRPNQIWHADWLHRYIHKRQIYVLFLLDDYSRFIVGAAMSDAERV